jgi:hypothetical protein
MPIYLSKALSNVTHMARGHDAWNHYNNDLWHWFKHASPLHFGNVSIGPEIAGINNPDQYVSAAREICRQAAAGDTGTEIKTRDRPRGDLAICDYLIWYKPPGVLQGLFLVIKDCGEHGEIETMFPPVEGKAYFERQAGEMPH